MQRQESVQRVTPVYTAAYHTLQGLRLAQLTQPCLQLVLIMQWTPFDLPFAFTATTNATRCSCTQRDSCSHFGQHIIFDYQATSLQPCDRVRRM